MNAQLNGHPTEFDFADAAQPTEVAGDHLPQLLEISHLASFVKDQADRIHASGQQIVGDFRKQLDALIAEAHEIEMERQEAIHQANIAAERRIARNEGMQRNVMAMISFYTGQMPPNTERRQEVAEVHVPARMAPRHGGFFRLLTGRA